MSRSKPVEDWDPYKDHIVEVVVETEAVQVYVLREAPRRVANAVQICFTPWGIGITGDLCPGGNDRGVWSQGGYGRAWFTRASSADYLAGKFLAEVWDRERARLELLDQADDEAQNAEVRAAYKTVAEDDWMDERGLYDALSAAGLDTSDELPGYGYREADVAMLLSLQARLRRHVEGGGA